MRAESFVIFVVPAVTIAMGIPSATAQEHTRRHYDLPEQDLKQAVRSVARRSKYQLIADAAAIGGKRSKALVGNYTLAEALATLLAGSGLAFEIKERTILIHPWRLSPTV